MSEQAKEPDLRDLVWHFITRVGSVEEIRQFLAAYPEVLGAESDVYFDEILEEVERQDAQDGGSRTRQVCGKVRLFRLCRTVGVTNALSAETQRGITLLSSWIDCESWEASQEFLDQNPALLSDDVYGLVDAMIEMQLTESARQEVVEHSAFLERCRSVGAEAALREKLKELDRRRMRGVMDLVSGLVSAPNPTDFVGYIVAHPIILGAADSQTWLVGWEKSPEAIGQLVHEILASIEQESTTEPSIRHKARLIASFLRQASIGEDGLQYPQNHPLILLLHAEALLDQAERFEPGTRERTELLAKAVDYVPKDAPLGLKALEWLYLQQDAEFESTGNSRLLSAREATMQAFLSHPTLPPKDIPKALLNLGATQRKHFQLTGILASLDSAIATYAQALELPGDNNIRATLLNNYGNCLYERFRLKNSRANLDAAKAAFAECVALTPADSEYRAGRLVNLGNPAMDAAVLDADENAMQAAIALAREGTYNTPAVSIDLPRRLNSLASGLMNLYEMTGNIANLDEATATANRCLDVTSTHSVERPGFVANIASIAWLRYRHDGNFAHLDSARSYFREAVDLGLRLSLGNALSCAENWLSLEFAAQHWNVAVEAYGLALTATDRLIRSQLDRGHQEQWLKRSRMLAARGAYALAHLGRLEEAAVALERGQARLLDDALALREVALRRLRLRGQLVLASQYAELIQAAEVRQNGGKPLGDIERAIMELHAQIREVPGFEYFMRSPDEHDIRMAADARCLVYLVAAEAGGLALISDRGHFSAVWLDGLTRQATLSLLFGESDTSSAGPVGYLTAYMQRATTSPGGSWSDILEAVTNDLSTIAMSPLMGALPQTVSEITLIPVGELGLLPLHAAWFIDNAGNRHYALDRLAINYTPSARLLLRNGPNAMPERFLGVADPRPTNLTPLPAAIMEVELAALHFADSTLVTGEAATVSAVLTQLKDCTVAHLSCHASADLMHPLSSGLSLAEDRRLAVQDLFDLELRHLRLAILSACETAVPGIELPEEGVTLAVGMLQAGAQAVIASQWAVDDLSTCVLISAFHVLWRQQQFSPSQALNRAQRWMRDTTNHEKLEYLAAAHSKTRSPATAAVLHALHRLRPGDRDFSHVRYWAGFTYNGAV